MLIHHLPEPEGHMEPQKLAELRDYYDNNSTEAEMSGGTWEAEVEPNPMVTTSLRLPRDLLEQVRAEAESLHMKPTALLRWWILERVTAGQSTINDRVTRLERAVFDDPSHASQ